MPDPRAEKRALRKEALFTQLRGVHDALTDAQDEHNATEYHCKRNGSCCVVGLQLHMMESEYIARNIKGSCGDDADALEAWIERLEHAFEDESWTWDTSVGEHMCAFYEDGCTVYPFRPGICRMYGVVLEVDEWCPRKKLPSGESFVFAQKDTDRLMADFYRTLDNYGRLYPKLDYTTYMPAGVLHFLAPPERLKALKKKTAAKFWKREKGYRTQFDASYKKPVSRRTNVKFAYPIPPSE